MAEQLVKLIWDFRHPDAEKVAEHHVKHVNEFIELKSISNTTSNYELVSPSYAIAYVITPKSNMLLIRDTLKPHRGEYV